MSEKTDLEDLDTVESVPAADPQTVVVGDADALPSIDDQVPANFGDAKVDDGGVRTNSAVEPVADVLATGAGAAHPPPANVDRDGREVFEDGVAPTALATYDGPGAPPEQGGDAVDAAQHESVDETGDALTDDEVDEVNGLVADNDGDELAKLAEAAGVAKSGSKIEVAERIVRARRND